MMKERSFHRPAAVLFLLASLLCASGRAMAQADTVSFTPVAGRIAVTVVMAEGAGTPVIMRRARSEPRNVILVNPTVTGAQLESALFAFLISEASDPDGHERDDRAAMRVTMPPSTPRFPGAAAALARLRAAPRLPIEGLASAASVEIWVSPRRGHRDGAGRQEHPLVQTPQ